MAEDQDTSAFRARLRQIVGTYGSVNSLARAIGRSEGTLRNWLAGPAEPGLSDLLKLCDVTGVGIEWLATGRGHPSSARNLRETRGAYASGVGQIDQSLLEDLLRALEQELQARSVELDPGKRAGVIATLYEVCRARSDPDRVDRELLARLVRLAT